MPLDVSVLAELDKLDAFEVKVRRCKSVLDELQKDVKELRWTADVLLSYEGSAAAAAAFKNVAIALALQSAGTSLTSPEWAIVLRRITIKDLHKSKLLRARLRALHLRNPALAAKLSHLPVHVSQDLPSLALRLARRWTVKQKIKVLVSFGREEMQRGNTDAIAIACVIEQALETDIAGKVVVDGGIEAIRRLLNRADPSSE